MLSKVAVTALISLAAADSGIGVYGTGATDAAKQELAYINKMRTNPKSYIPKLQAMLPKFKGNLYNNYMRTSEGAAAVKDAISFLQNQPAVPALQWDKYLQYSCQDYDAIQGPTGETGHYSGGTSPGSRIEKYGDWQRHWSENLAYSGSAKSDPEGVVLQLVIDDGVSDRGHRKNIFSTSNKIVGVAVGPHSHYGYMACQDFAGGFSSSGSATPSVIPDQPKPSPKPSPTPSSIGKCGSMDCDGRCEITHPASNKTTYKCYHPNGAWNSRTVTSSHHLLMNLINRTLFEKPLKCSRDSQCPGLGRTCATDGYCSPTPTPQETPCRQMLPECDGRCEISRPETYYNDQTQYTCYPKRGYWYIRIIRDAEMMRQGWVALL